MQKSPRQEKKSIYMRIAPALPYITTQIQYKLASNFDSPSVLLIPSSVVLKPFKW